MAKKTKKNQEVEVVQENTPEITSEITTIASHSILGKNRFSKWCFEQHKAQLQGVKDYAIREVARKALESEDFQSKQATRILALRLSEAKNGIKQGQVYYETWLYLKQEFPVTYESVFRKFATTLCGEKMQIVTQKKARYLLVKQIPSVMRQEAISHLYGTIIDSCAKLNPKDFEKFLRSLSLRYKVLKRKNVDEIRSGLNVMAASILDIKTPEIPVTPEITPVAPVTGDIPPVTPPEPEIEPMVEVDTVKPVVFRFPDIDALDKAEDSNGLFLQSLKAFQGLVMSLQIDPLQYLSPDITGQIGSLQKELTILSDRIRLERAHKAA